MFSLTDWAALAAAFLGIGGLVGLGEALRRWGCQPAGTRRLVHVGVGLFVVGTPLLFSTPGPVYVLAAAFVVINGVAKGRRWWAGVHAARPESWGTVAMPLGLLPALAATWAVGVDRVYLLQTAFLVLAVADPLASWVGRTAGRREWLSGATVEGSGGFLGIAFVLVGGALQSIGGWAPPRAVGAAGGVAVVTTAVEAIGRRGWDNFFVVLGVIVVLVPLHEGHASIEGLMGAIGIAAGFGGAAYLGRVLDARGAVAGGLFAFSLVWLGGWGGAVPAVVFFVLSSALSLVRRDPAETQEKAEAGRTLRQVLANGGVAWGFLAVSGLGLPEATTFHVVCYAGFLGALAAAAADTWATELGAWASARPWSLRNWSRVPAGHSGAVSLGGTAAAALGAGTVAVAAGLTGGPIGPVPWGQAAGIVGAGLVGMVADSLAGAFLQARYREPDTGRLVEWPPGSDVVPVQGWRSVDNEIVNGLGTTVGALAAIVFW